MLAITANGMRKMREFEVFLKADQLCCQLAIEHGPFFGKNSKSLAVL